MQRLGRSVVLARWRIARDEHFIFRDLPGHFEQLRFTKVIVVCSAMGLPIVSMRAGSLLLCESVRLVASTWSWDVWESAVGESLELIFTCCYAYQNGALQHSSVLQQLSHCRLSTKLSEH